MFSKDASFQIALDSAPEELRAAFKDRSLDQPGVLVAYIEDVLAEGFVTGIGTAATAVFGTCIAILFFLTFLLFALRSIFVFPWYFPADGYSCRNISCFLRSLVQGETLAPELWESFLGVPRRRQRMGIISFRRRLPRYYVSLVSMNFHLRAANARCPTLGVSGGQQLV